jgi:hypothetical protein
MNPPRTSEIVAELIMEDGRHLRNIDVMENVALPSGIENVDYDPYGALSKYIRDVPHEILELDKYQLEVRLKPGITEHQLKESFLREVFSAIENNSEISIAAVCRGICGSMALKKRFENPIFVSWVMTSLASVEKDYSALISMGIQHMEQVMLSDIETVDDNGNTKIDIALSEAKMRIIKFATERLHGQAMARSEIKKMSINISEQKIVDRYKLKDPNSISEIEEKLRLLKSEQRHLEESKNGNEKDQ